MSPLFSSQELRCCICGTTFATAVATGRWSDGVCSMRCFHEKQWRGVLSTMGKPYRPDDREYDSAGFPRAKP
jgi:hypothetical protein